MKVTFECVLLVTMMGVVHGLPGGGGEQTQQPLPTKTTKSPHHHVKKTKAPSTKAPKKTKAPGGSSSVTKAPKATTGRSRRPTEMPTVGASRRHTLRPSTSLPLDPSSDPPSGSPPPSTMPPTTASPTVTPSQSPSTAHPSPTPSLGPSNAVSAMPTSTRSDLPSLRPSQQPSNAPSESCRSNGTNIFVNDAGCFHEALGRAALTHCESFGNTTRQETTVVNCGALVNSNHLCNGYFASLKSGFTLRTATPGNVVVSVVPNLFPHVDHPTIGPDLFETNLVVDFTAFVTAVSLVVWCPAAACIGSSLTVLDPLGHELASTVLPDLGPTDETGLPVGIVAAAPIGSIAFFNAGEASEVIGDLCFEA